MMLLMSTEKRRGRPPKPDSKRSQAADRHAHPRKAFHAPEELFTALSKYVLDTKPQTSDAAVLRLALEEFLEKRGYWPLKATG